MRVLVTGATGFLGDAVVTAALAAGHEVIGLRRPSTAANSQGGLTWLAADLRQAGNLAQDISNVEGVIHCASATSGDLATQLASTVLATENLLEQIPADLQRFIHVSSFSVYDFDAPGGTISEDTPLETQPLRRDAYTQAKLIQERLVREFAAARRMPLVVARPGAIYGPGKTWDWGRALAVGKWDLIFSPMGRMRLIHVTNCAQALVNALSTPLTGELIVNLVDAEQPRHWQFHRLARRAGADTGIGVPVPYAAVLMLGWSAKLASRLFFEGRAKLPELLDTPRQRARWRPLKYSRNVARAELNADQRVTLERAIGSMCKGVEARKH